MLVLIRFSHGLLLQLRLTAYTMRSRSLHTEPYEGCGSSSNESYSTYDFAMVTVS
jgi:hypothetical protein